MGLGRYEKGLRSVQPSEQQRWDTIAGGRKAVIAATAASFLAL
jgi:hypothetical protein